MTQTLYVSLAAHGYGHVGQTAPIVNELVRRNPRLKVVLRCAHPRQFLQTHFHCPFDHHREEADFGMIMAHALEVNEHDSHQRYLRYHLDWEQQLRREVERLEACRADLVLANVSYLTAAAAAHLGLPTLLLCSLNWADIYAGYCERFAEAASILEQMKTAYQSATCFLKPVPTMPMDWLTNGTTIGPIARVVANKRSTLCQTLHVDGRQRFVLISLGGVRDNMSFEALPQEAGITWILSTEHTPRRQDIVHIDECDMPFIDVLASSDAFITKPGYGSFAEGAANRVPILYLSRPHWPEEPFLVEWLKDVGICRELTLHDLGSAELLNKLTGLWEQPEKPLVLPTGIDDAVSVITPFLTQRTPVG